MMQSNGFRSPGRAVALLFILSITALTLPGCAAQNQTVLNASAPQGEPAATFPPPPALMAEYSRISFMVRSGDYRAAEREIERLPKRDTWPLPLKILEIEVLIERNRLNEANRLSEALLEAFPDRPEAYMTRANYHLRTVGGLDSAIETLEAGTIAAPENTEILETLGRCYSTKMQEVRTVGEQKEIVSRLKRIYLRLVELRTGRAVVPYLNVLSLIEQDDQEYEAAIGHLRQITQINPSVVDAHVRKARLQQYIGQTDEALATLRRALLLHPENPDIQQQLGRIFQAAEIDPEEFFAELATEYPGRDSIQLQYARILLENGRADRAVEVLHANLEIHPNNTAAWLFLAGAESERANIEESRRALEEFVAHTADRPQALDRAVRFALAIRDNEQAERFLGELRETDPDYPQLNSLSADMAMARKDYEKAVPLLLDSREKTPEELAVFPSLAEALIGLERYAQAEEILSEALRDAEERDNWDMLAMLLVRVHENSGEIEKALSIFDKAVERPDARVVPWTLVRARFHIDLQQREKALEILNRLVEENASSNSILHDVGVVLWEMGEWERSEEVLRQAIVADPGAADPYNTLAYLFAEADMRLDEGMELVRKALELKPGAGYIIDTLGWLQYKLGNYEEAVESLKEAIRLEAGDPTIHEHLARAYLKLDRKEDAIRHFRAALRNEPREEETAEAIREELRKLGVEEY